MLISVINTRDLGQSNWCHTIYNLELAPLDYYLFWSIAHFLCGWCFSNQDEVEASVKEFFALKDESWYQHWIKGLAERWLNQAYSLDLAHLGLLFVLIHGSLLALAMLQQLRGDGSFSKDLCLKVQELVLVWDQRM